LEELDRVARGVVEQDLPAARAADDLVSELDVGGTEPFDLGVDVVHDKVDAVPAARFGFPSVGHRSAGGARRAGEEQPEVAAQDFGERRRGVMSQLKVELLT
jgi:hypothetical protein